MSHGFGPILPDGVLKLVDKRDRHLLGKSQETFDEVMSRAKVRVERDLQRLIIADLNRRGVVVIHSGMHRRTSTPAGTPDLIFAIKTGAFAIEVKLPKTKETPIQETMLQKLADNGWKAFTVRSFDDYKKRVFG